MHLNLESQMALFAMRVPHGITHSVKILDFIPRGESRSENKLNMMKRIKNAGSITDCEETPI